MSEQPLQPDSPLKFQVKTSAEKRAQFHNMPINYSGLKVMNQTYSGSGTLSIAGDHGDLVTANIFSTIQYEGSGKSRVFMLDQATFDKIQFIDDHLELHL